MTPSKSQDVVSQYTRLDEALRVFVKKHLECPYEHPGFHFATLLNRMELLERKMNRADQLVLELLEEMEVTAAP